jgi:hypothetical protein
VSKQRCSRWVWWFGTPVLDIYDQEPGEVEQFVRSVANSSGQKVDWNSSGGHAIVRACGDLDKVMSAITEFQDKFKFKCLPL